MDDRRDDMRSIAMQRGAAMRQQALSIAAKRKQEYLGARVPKALREKIILKAEALGIPVSILIRNILTDYIDRNVDDIAPGVLPPAESAQPVIAKVLFEEVIGWEKLTLNKEVVCGNCTKLLSKGSEVVYGVVPGKNHVILCEQCKSLDGIG